MHRLSIGYYLQHHIQNDQHKNLGMWCIVTLFVALTTEIMTKKGRPDLVCNKGCKKSGNLITLKKQKKKIIFFNLMPLKILQWKVAYYYNPR